MNRMAQADDLYILHSEWSGFENTDRITEPLEDLKTSLCHLLVWIGSLGRHFRSEWSGFENTDRENRTT